MGGRRFTPDEITRLRAEYRPAWERGELSVLAAEMGRTLSSLFSKAYDLGITAPGAARGFAARSAGDARRGKPQTWPHPKGFAGKIHSPVTRQKCSDASNKFWGSMSATAKQDHVNYMLKAAIAKNGRIGPLVNNRSTTWKAGWREIGGTRKYYRSRWEANYARYLNWLQHRGDILDWKHEPETFWFEPIKRGVRSYLPDFRVWENDGTSKLHEVKGWMDSRSKTTLRRMKKYHPAETIILVERKQYEAIARQLGALIEGWE